MGEGSVDDEVDGRRAIGMARGGPRGLSNDGHWAVELAKRPGVDECELVGSDETGKAQTDLRGQTVDCR